MKKIIQLFILSLLIATCGKDARHGEPIITKNEILKDSKSFLNYYYKYLRMKMSDDFVPLNSDYAVVSREDFFKQLATGKYLPLRLKNKTDTIFFQLVSLGANIDRQTSDIIRGLGDTQLKYTRLEKKPLPNLNLTDLDGNVYNTINTNGKYLVLKFWFLQCGKCVEEIPAFNSLINKYKERGDIVFLNLLFDNSDSVKKFIFKTPLNCNVVADKKEYIFSLEIRSFPTYCIIDKNGIVVKVVGSFQEMQTAIEKLI